MRYHPCSPMRTDLLSRCARYASRDFCTFSFSPQTVFVLRQVSYELALRLSFVCVCASAARASSARARTARCLPSASMCASAPRRSSSPAPPAAPPLWPTTRSSPPPPLRAWPLPPSTPAPSRRACRRAPPRSPPLRTSLTSSLRYTACQKRAAIKSTPQAKARRRRKRAAGEELRAAAGVRGQRPRHHLNGSGLGFI